MKQTDTCDLCERGIEHVSPTCYNYAGHTTKPQKIEGGKKIPFINKHYYTTQQTIKIMKQKEIVICAAVKATNGEIIRGHRHGDCIVTMRRMDLKPSSSADSQGFITSKNRYVTREVGRKLQEAAGIVSADPEGYRGKTLFSEDLY